jgi:NodT family efflux transporter outer membrane factor (OMF) lipoprotein
MRIPFPLTLILLLAGCTVGPDYAGPPALPSDQPVPARFARAAAATAPIQPALGSWWTGLGDPILDQLETRALAANPNVAVAEARLRQARAGLRLEKANALPSGSASATYLHARIPGVDLGTEQSAASDGGQQSGGGASALDFYNVGFDASWEIDLFGGKRRGVEAARASADAAEADLADAQLSLTADVAQAYVSLRDRQHRLLLARQSAEMQRRMLALTRQRRDNGTASSLDVERLTAELESSDAEVPPLAGEIETYLNALAVLTGTAPGSLDTLLATAASIPLPPPTIAVGDPAGLLRQRPDIRAAERQIAAKTAQIGVAEAARFPKLTLLGIIGLGGTSVSDLTDLGNITAIGAPMLQWNILDFGRGGAKVDQAKGARDEAAARYQLAVLGALRDAEDALTRFGQRRATVAGLARSSAAADRAAALERQRYAAGTVTLIDTLDTERQQIAAANQLSIATAGLTTDFVSLQKALGLGWAAPRR